MRSPRPGARRAAAALLAAVLLGLPASGCRLVTELFHMEPLRVTAWRPDAERVDPAAVPDVRITFSSPVHRSRAEGAFSLKEGAAAVAGTFSWRDADRVLVFTPLAPLARNTRYTLTVTTAAEDLYGNSLADELERSFRTALETGRPSVLSTAPADGEDEVPPRRPVEIVFSEAVDAASLYAGFSITPRVAGGFAWSGAGSAVTFTPLEDYQAGEEYAVRLDPEITDLNGNPLVEALTFRFRAAAAADPAVLAVEVVRDGTTLQPVTPGVFLDPELRVEKDDRFRLAFSDAVPAGARGGIFSIEPPVPFILQWEDGWAGCTVSFTEHLEWQAVHELRVLDSIYRFRVNGANSLPVTVAGVSYCADSGALPPVFTGLQFGFLYDFPDSAGAVFRFRLLHSENAAIPLASFLQALRISGDHGCIDVDLLDVTLAPGPAGETTAEAACTVTDNGLPGTVTLAVAAGLTDSLGNALAEPFTLVVNTP